MIQLKVYPTVDKLRTQQIFLDLYDSEPIKLNLSIEDITDADATSVFSRQFKIPATRNNNLFFKTAFEVNGTDYDVTIKKPAEILVDGQEFRQGHIRLQKIYVNNDLDKTDYQLLFLGETRDFSTVIGDAPLCQLLMPDLQVVDPQTGANRNPTVDDIELSWQAFPQTSTVDSEGNPNGGLSNGNLLFPLIDHGNNYDEEGAVVGSTMQIGNGAQVRSFTESQYPLETSKLKPMIRAKRIMDQIFEDAGYTYTSTFFNSPRFNQMYVSAFGNEAITGYTASGSGENLCNAEYNRQDPQMFGDNLWLPDNVYDPGSNLILGNIPNGSKYVVGGDVPAGDPNTKLRISAEAYVFALVDVSCPGGCTDPVPARLQLVNVSTGQVYKSSGYGYDDIVSFTFDSEFDGVGVLAGSLLALRVDPLTDPDRDEVKDIKFQVQNAPGTLLPTSMLDCEYKQIDFVKDILKMFRLVLAPDRNDSKNFIVEPWQTYINSGNLHDWSHKLVNQKDMVLEPLFNTQSEEIEFRMQQDEDWINKFHFDQFKEPYGYLKFDSNNELLKGTRNITTIGIAPTPMGTIQEDAVNTNHQAPGFIFPQVHVNETEDTGLKHLPMKAKTRLLFYNGLAPVPQSGGALKWYLQTASNFYTTYPLVSSFEDWPQQTTGLNINWSNDINYWVQSSLTQVFSNEQGGTLYTEYWSRYINSLYNKFSRRLTAYFVLNNVDLQDLSFDDTIFVNGKYYRPEKIIDVNIGERTEVKVQLITANDFTPPAYIDEQLTNFSLLPTGEVCGCDGIITVVTDGATPFTYQLSNGQTGQIATTGGNPQQFDIDGLCAGTYNVLITDDLGRSNSGSVVIPENSGTPVQTSEAITGDTSCGAGGNCTGAVTVTPSGGSGSYEVTWQYGQSGPTTGPTLTGLCGNTEQPYIITDLVTGCVYPFTASIPCADPVVLHKLSQHLNGCTQNSSQFYWAESQVSYQPGTTVDLNEIAGCFVVINNDQGTPQYTINNSYTNCSDCNTQTPPQIYKAEATCYKTVIATPDLYIDAAANPGIEIGQSVKFVNNEICYEVTELITGNNSVTQVDSVYETCEDCDADGVFKYIIEGCNGFNPSSPPPSGGSTPQTGQLVDDGEYAISPIFTSAVHDAGDTNIPICERQSLWVSGTDIDGTATPPAGWYWFETNLRLDNLVALPTDAVVSLVRINDPVGSGANYGEIINVIETYQLPNKGASDTNVFTVQSAASHYLPEDSTQRFAIILHRADGGACVQGGGTNSDFAVVNSVTGAPGADFTNVEMYWLGDFATGSVMEANGPLNIGDVVNVNESEAQGCYEVIALANPDDTTEFTYNETNGVFEDCATCTGGNTAQHCYQVTASVGGAEISYYFDDGGVCATCVGLAEITLALTSNQVVTICAQINSITTISGSIVSAIDSGEECDRYVDPITSVVGTTCDTPSVATKYCYTVTGAGFEGTFSTFTWLEDNEFRRARLLYGTSMSICANQNSIIETSGTITVVGGTTVCDSVADCVGTCHRYAYDGPPKVDLIVKTCDGDLVYYPDCIGATQGQPNSLFPDCIAEIVGGTGQFFVTTYSTCT